MWFQYVVGYDKQEQRSLVTSLRRELVDLRRESISKFDRALEGFPRSIRPILIVLASLSAFVAGLLLTQRIRKLGWWRGLQVWNTGTESQSSRIDFYERLLTLLAKRGLKRESHQTPLEFAALVGAAEATIITAAYNRVRFGRQRLSTAESRALEAALANLEKGLAQ